MALSFGAGALVELLADGLAEAVAGVLPAACVVLSDVGLVSALASEEQIKRERSAAKRLARDSVYGA